MSSFALIRRTALIRQAAGFASIDLSREHATAVLNASTSEVGSELRSRITIAGEDARTHIVGLAVIWT